MFTLLVMVFQMFSFENDGLSGDLQFSGRKYRENIPISFVDKNLARDQDTSDPENNIIEYFS